MSEKLRRLIQLPAPAHYAVEGMRLLARSRRSDFRLAGDVARRAGLPIDYLSKVFHRLATRGLLEAKRGPGGGYRLSRDPAVIRLSEIVDAALEPAAPSSTCLLGVGACNEASPCPAHPAVLLAERTLRQSLARLTLQDFVRR